MTNREEEIGRAVFETVFEAAKGLNVFELLTLRTIYAAGKRMDDSGWTAMLPESLRRKFFQLGVDICGKLMRIR